MVKIINHSKEAERKFEEFYEILNEAYEKYLDFYEAKCKSCGGNCHETTRAIEIHTRFAMDVFAFTGKKLSERCPELSTAVNGILLDFINKWTIFGFISEVSKQITNIGDTGYIM